MGATCNHERTEKAGDEKLVHKGIFFSTFATSYKCMDCPQTIQREELRGNIFGWKYSIKNIDPKTCKHTYYTIDEETQEVFKEQTLDGTFLRLFMGPAMDGIQYNEFLFAHAKCNSCGFLFCVRAEFKKVWDNQTQVNKRTTKWKPITKEENGVESYVAVDKNKS